uniref:Uncharacterized protein n=1 Tax=Anguilla anguilla TaxID=7936 RepID=A0A0E9X3C9_ANGAN
MQAHKSTPFHHPMSMKSMCLRQPSGIVNIFMLQGLFFIFQVLFSFQRKKPSLLYKHVDLIFYIFNSRDQRRGKKRGKKVFD